MPTLDPRLGDLFDLSDFTVGSRPGTTAGTIAQKNAIIDVINTIFADSTFYKFYAGLMAVLPQNYLADNKLHPVLVPGSSPAAFYAAYDQSLIPGESPVGINALAFSAGIIAGGIDVADRNGGSFTESFAGVLIHEITHALLTPAPFNGAYREEPTIFLTNYWDHVILSQTGERVGHNDPTSNGGLTSASAINYLTDLELTSFHRPTDASDSTVLSFENAVGDKVVKTYFGEDYKGAPFVDGLDHLITIAITAGAGNALTSGSLLADTRLEAAFAASLIDDATTTKFDYLQATRTAFDALVTDITAMQTAGTHFYWLTGFSQSMSALTAGTMLTVSAERFIDGNAPGGGNLRDVVGPVVNGGLSPASHPETIALTAGDNGSLVFGASGFIGAAGTSSSSVDLTGTRDVLIGGTGNDILMLGGGEAQNLRSVAAGGDGSNILVGSLTSASAGTLIAGTGWHATTFISGSGHDYLIGHPSPADIASYANSPTGVTIDLSTSADITYQDAGDIDHTVAAFYGHGGNAEGDRYSGIDVFMGSAHDDTFTSNSSGALHTFIGGDGNDTFNVYSGDVAFGGAGADIFNLTTNGSSSTFWLYGLDNNDQIFIDGTRYLGRTLTYARVIDHYNDNGDPIWTYDTVSDTQSGGDWIFRGHVDSKDGPLSGFGYIVHNLGTDPSTTIYATGFQHGDPAGMTFALDYPIYEGPDYGVNAIGTTNQDTTNEADWWYSAYISGSESFWKGMVGFPMEMF